MSDWWTVLLWTIFSLGVVVLKLGKSKSKDPIGYILLFYFFFGFGPVVNYLLGMPIYFGIVKEHIPSAAMIMSLGILSFAFPHLIFKDHSLVPDENSDEPHRWEALKIALMGSIVYGGAKCLLMLPLKAQGATKIEMISIALPQLHYIYLLLQLYFCAFYFSAKRVDGLAKIYWLNVAVYIVYCLVVAERDFIFPLASIFIMKSLVEGKKVSWRKLAFGGVSLGVLGTIIFYLRDGTQEAGNIVSAVLSQGSILFINTFVLKVFEQGHEFFYGETFLNSLINLAPSFVYKTDYNNLAWFKNLYAPASDSGYGFALDAEGYINFGFAGVVLVYLSLAFYWRVLLSKFSSSEFFRYLTLFSVGFVMYALRNDSLALFKGILYAIIIYLFINTTSYLLSIRKNA
ncbi:MAG: hypothetical protein CME64_16415 [Halobacteriovoraceae bacterium]|nr:hypothetical protein [Halobacteriovoraceae bacterium]|tara:strand:+ start:102613 stop:103815 length:1203 start_codon:yes stop_codon:yes gene_type:complete